MTLYSADCGCIAAKRPSCLRATLCDVLRKPCVAKALAELLDLVLLAALAELLFDGPHLLAEDVLALRLPLVGDHRADLLLHAKELELAVDDAEHRTDARLGVEGLEDLLLVARRSPAPGRGSRR